MEVIWDTKKIFEPQQPELILFFSKIIDHIDKNMIFFEDLDLDTIAENINPAVKEMTQEALSLIANGTTMDLLDIFFDNKILLYMLTNPTEKDMRAMILAKNILKIIRNGDDNFEYDFYTVSRNC